MARKKIVRKTPEERLKIVKEGLLPNVKVADLCRYYEIYPTDYYRWKKLAESAMIEGLKPSKKKEKKLSRREQEFQKENEHLKAVIIQLTKEHLELKKKVQISE